MPCRLCGADRPLISAHVIPKSFHRIAAEERQPSRLLTNVAGRYARKLRKGVYDPNLVCLDCERRFSPWDDYAAELFLKKWEGFDPIIENGTQVGYALPAFDYPKLKLFFLSLLWRAAVSDHEMFYQVDVRSHEPHLRAALLSEEPGDAHHYGVILQAFDSTEVGMLNPQPDRFDGIKFYRFYLAHIIGFVKVDARPLPQAFLQAALAENRRLVLAIKNFASSPERAIMRQLVLDDQRE